eukprot:6572823-Karenia_brevis.AAC.1
MLSSFLEVVSPKPVKEIDIVQGVHHWERKVADLKTWYGEEVGGNFKLAVFMSILPKEYREEILKLGSGDERSEYDNVRSYVLSLAQQRPSSMTPKPSEVLGVEGQGEAPVEQEKYSTDEWLPWMWDYQ